MTPRDLWHRYRDYLCTVPDLGLTLDVSRMTFADDFLARMEPAMQAAFTAMDKLEAGDIANPDENRMVGHYWLRAPELAPTAEITTAITQTNQRIHAFADAVHEGRIAPESAAKFTEVLAIGIGGSALGPQFVTNALGTAELSAVGLLPAALQGFDIDAMLQGARAMDVVTRRHDARNNPSALLALMWHYAGNGRGERDMVILPYKDRLELFSRYLQQLVMESLGKEKDLAGNTVHQGIAVYGNKGSTDQHAYVQQLRDGVNNFFITFIEVLQDRGGGARSMWVEPDVTSGDYLSGFYQG